jgi:dTDP-4-amino-4,6-dideoxygalactose transaminase
MPKKYHHEVYGHNYRMESIQGAVLGVKLNHLGKWTNARRAIAQKYCELLSDLPDIKLPVELAENRHVYHLFVIQLEEGGKQRRDALADYLKEKGIATGFHYPIPLHLQKCFAELGYEKGDFPVSEKLAESGLSLPIFPELSWDQASYVCNQIKTFNNK